MTYFERLEHFWRLDAQASFSANETRLYFYLLNQFNAARWAGKIYRRTNQVAADLNADPKTIDTARRVLQQRELLTYVAGNKSASATWSLDIERNFSGQSAADRVEIDRKNSEQSSVNPADRVEMDRKNSGPIRNRERLEVEEDQTPLRVCVGEAAEEITLAPLPTEVLKIVPPVAEPPHAGQPGPVAAAELPEALAAEAKALANELATLWDFTEMSNQPRWAKLHRFTRRMATLGRLPEVRRQLAGYRAGHIRGGVVRPHKLDTWLGNPADDYAEGEWCGCDWAGVAAKVQQRPGGPAPLPAQAAINIKNVAAQQRQTIIT